MPLESTTRPSPRRRRRALVGLAGALALVAAACGGGDDQSIDVEERPTETTEATTSGPREVSSDELVRASEATSAAETGRMRLHIAMDMTAPGQAGAISTEIEAEGSFDNSTGQAEIVMDMGPYMRDLAESTGEPLPPELGDLTITQVVDGDTIYMRSPMFAQMGVATEWVSLDPASLGQSAGLTGGFDASSSSSPTGFLESLRGTGTTVNEVGTEDVDGDETTIYEGAIDPQAAVANAPAETREEVERALGQAGMDEIPFRAWVDDDDQVRRLEMTMAMDQGGVSITMVMTIELSELGEPVDITVPPASEVTPFDQLMGGAMAGGPGAAGATQGA